MVCWLFVIDADIAWRLHQVGEIYSYLGELDILEVVGDPQDQQVGQWIDISRHER